MADPNVPLNINNTIAEILKRLRNLETRDPLRDAAMQVIVDNGTPDVETQIIARFGDIDGEGPSGAFGIEIGSHLAQPVFRVDTVDGQTYPDLALPYAGTAISTAVIYTDSVEHQVWLTYFDLNIAYKGFRYRGAVWTDVGTTAECWLQDAWGAQTAKLVIGSGTTGSYNVHFKWLHGQPIGGANQITFRVRRTSGAGQVFVYTPVAFTLTGPEECTVTGV